ncbi:MAG: zinc ribbon domain-containing protein [Pirellulales bacterium]|nr:zinc ribbon domain-containing protein [Pirellulales bacterium]
MDDIPAWLENATLITWCWHYSNAVGGVKLFVPEPHLRQASEVLSSATQPRESISWQCPRCRAEVYQDWRYCWSCGTSKEGTEDAFFFTEQLATATDADDTISNSLTISLVTVFVVFLFITANEPGVMMFVLPFVLLFALIAQGLYFAAENLSDNSPQPDEAVPPSVCREPQEPPNGSVADSLARESEAILRLWQASVLSFFFFPPLALYVLWKLWRLDRHTGPLSPRDHRRYWGAWAVSFIAVPIGVPVAVGTFSVIC